jgi:hypothetical protein
MHCVSKMFASQGDHGNYYLNEYLSLLAWKNAPLPPASAAAVGPAAPASTTSAATATETATETAIREAVAAAGAALNKAKKLVTLPSVKSSRQIITTELAAAIMCNIPDYAEYAHDHRVEADPNQLVNVVWNGLRDRYAKAGLNSRGLRFVLINAPARFVIKSLVDRCQLHKVMGIIRSTIVQLGEIRERCFLGDRDWRPPLDMLKTNILAEFPQWTEKFEQWEKKNSKYHKRVYDVGVGGELWSDTALLLMAAVEPMVSSLDRNRDPDDEQNELLRHAPVDTDEVESGFGCLDQALYRTIAGIYAAEGIALSMKLHAFDTQVDKERLKRKRLGLKHNEAVEADDWKMTDWYSYPIEFRWKLIQEVSKNRAAAKKQHKKEMAAQATTTMQRHKEDRAKEVNKMMNAALRFQDHKRTPLASTAESLAAMVDAAGDKPAARDEVVRAQLRLRKYCYGIKNLPNITEKDSTALHQNMAALLVKEQATPLSRMLPQPSAMVIRPSHHAPDQHALAMDKQHMDEVLVQQKKLMMLVSLGNFTASRREKPTTIRAPRSKRARRPPQAREETEEEREYEYMCMLSWTIASVTVICGLLYSINLT